MQTFFLKLFTSRISRQNPGVSRQKSLIFLVSRDTPNFLAPTPSRGRPPPHWRISGPKSLGLGSFFLPESQGFGSAPKERRRRRAEKRLSKRVFLESPFLLCTLKVFSVLRATLGGGREETDSPKTPFWTTVSLHDAFAAPLARSQDFPERRKLTN